jgi:signal transduction histidine kinase
VSWQRRLADVAWDVQDFYRSRAYQTLTVSPQAILHDQREDDVERAFRFAPADGVKAYFLSSPFETSANIKVTLYDPVERRRVYESWRPAEWAALSASSAYFSLILRDARVDPNKLVFGEDDPANRVIAKPITDAASRPVGVAGMIVDTDYFEKVVLPTALPDALRRHFSEGELGEMSIAVVDEDGRQVQSVPASERLEPEVAVPLELAFSRWRLAATTRGLTQEQLATRNFQMNFSLTILNTVALIVGLALMFRAARKELKISQMKSDFVSNVSHELRTPLSSIRCLGEFLRSGREIEPGKLRKYGEYIETESQRLAKLINNILDFSKIESGQRTYDFQEQQVEFVIAEVMRVFEVRLVQRGFAVDVDVPDDLLPPILIDPDAVTQALANLLDNAIKYSGSSREIRIRAFQQGPRVVVSVTDFGVGIPRAEQDKIFDRFHRVSTGLVHNVKGSGLGLSLVKHIMEAHGGSVSVESEAGKGSTFTLRFPTRSSISAPHMRPTPALEEPLRFELGDRIEPKGSDA